MAQSTAVRSGQLSKLLRESVQGRRAVNSHRDVILLLQAICNESDNADCVERIGTSSTTLDSLRKGLRFDVSVEFINGALHDFLVYLSAPSVKLVCHGSILKRLLAAVVSPPTLWDSMVTAYDEGHLTPVSKRSFAWLLVELVAWTEAPPINVDAVDAVAQRLAESQDFVQADDRELRDLGYKLSHLLSCKSSVHGVQTAGPGGRHDNDFIEFRKISIYPTEDELTSKERPYYRTGSALYELPISARAGFHLDNQFRLLREDFLAELRDDIAATTAKKKGRSSRNRISLRQLDIADPHRDDSKHKTPFSLAISARKGLESVSTRPSAARRPFLKENPSLLKHNSLGYFLEKGKVIAFATVFRDEDLLVCDPPVVRFRVPGEGALQKLLMALKMSSDVEFALLDTAVFAYEPVLRCLQSKLELPLWEHILNPQESNLDTLTKTPLLPLTKLCAELEGCAAVDLQSLLGLSKSVVLDESQLRSLLAGLRQTVSLIQGPPGTGKSFIGALLAHIIHNHTNENILVICFTNHALDQFLEDLMDIGIPQTAIVRLGAKSSPRTKPLNLREGPTRKRTHGNWDAINRLTTEVNFAEMEVEKAMFDLKTLRDSKSVVFEYLEFSDEESDYDFFEAFQVPKGEDGFRTAGKRKRPVDDRYLLDRWSRGEDPGIFLKHCLSSPRHLDVWSMGKAVRYEKIQHWTRRILAGSVEEVSHKINAFSAVQSTLQEALDQRDSEVIRERRIVACTTTAAAKYTKHLQGASPGVILVEEAGEILESHVVTAMTQNTRQLILIGDHQQLRPKVNNYALTVERGDGFDLNMSLFERLVKSDFPHTTLQRQHRMCPEISRLVRSLTYPDLLDAEATNQREQLRGIRGRVIFVQHEKPESASEIADRRDEGFPASKEHPFEASMVLKTVKYLAQQGYGTSNQVVLTPYLGQLSRLRRELAQENDPVLNDMDAQDLMKQSVAAPNSQSSNKIRISTIDNYQGEESDIVIVSLTRSNAESNIGFMKSPERLNVMISRARKALIVFGNPATFLASRSGGELWGKFFSLLNETGSIHNGLPVGCENHPDCEMVLSDPADFDTHCPDGGCSAKCATELKCGHECPRRCHPLSDHTKMQCLKIVQKKCPRGHHLLWKCANGHPTSCYVCDAEARAQAKRQERLGKLEEQRREKQRLYAARLAEIQAELDYQQHLAQIDREETDLQDQLRQRQEDLELAKKRTAQKLAEKTDDSSKKAAVYATKVKDQSVLKAAQIPSNARMDWEYQKTAEGAANGALDSLMGMVGLEEVKEQFLEIKSKIDLAARQGLDLGKERLGAAFLGNPGTGKTTVARLYSRFLASVGALPGNHFVDISGAKLASEGVKGCEKILDTIQNKGGGALFIDEAYQLTSGAHPGGAAVLDSLLTEVEDLTGKVVFILAGYDKNMEKFFAHNPGLPSRFPRTFQFADYEDNELLEIFVSNVDKRYNGRMKIEDGHRGLYARIFSHRLGRGRCKEGFGNARAVENAVTNIGNRQARRIRAAHKARNKPDELLLTKEDVIGPRPSDVLSNNKAWQELHAMVGLRTVKESVKALFDSLEHNYERELHEEPIVDFNLNKVFLGSPGTGKTTVAKLYGQILADIGMLSSGDVVIKKPADFVGAVIGASEANTKAILDAAIGKVLVIDEAYGLFDSSRGGGDSFRKAIIDTIVAEVQSVPGDDRCVLLLGYKEEMENMMQNTNPGLARRFPIDSGFVFEDFDDDDMARIFDTKLKKQEFQVTDVAKTVALHILSRARNRPHFGNAGEVDILLNDAKMRQQKRLAKDQMALRTVLEAVDFDPEFQRSERAVTNIASLFSDTIGCENIVTQLQDYQNMYANTQKLGMDPREVIPFAFLFKGPPGTGKTTTAKRMGKVYYDMGFLAKAQVVTCSASDLVGEYVGHTGPKTRKLLESALGKIILIDEAYRLAEGHFAQEALDELVDCMTSEKFQQKLIVILAGYDADINRLMSKNPGLTSRFPETINFTPFNPQECFNLLASSLGKYVGLDVSVLSDPTLSFKDNVSQRFAHLVLLDNFANARDVLTLSRTIFGAIVKQPSSLGRMTVTEADVLGALNGMIHERTRRAAGASNVNFQRRQDPAMDLPIQSQPQANNATDTKMNVDTSEDAEEATQAPEDDSSSETADEDREDGSADTNIPPSVEVHRDAGVNDAVWQQLQLDKLREEEEERELQRLREEEAAMRAFLKACEDARRRKELEELERQRKAQEEQKQREALAKEKLRRMGRCPVGYDWIKQSGGYRCAGGSHWLTDGQVDALGD